MKIYQVTDSKGNTLWRAIGQREGLDAHFEEVSKEEYERLKSLTYQQVKAEIEPNLSDSIKYGYGFYGHCLEEFEGRCWLGIITGTTCD